MLGEKARWKLHKDSECCFEQIQESEPHKTAAVQPFATNISNYAGTIDEIKTNS